MIRPLKNEYRVINDDEAEIRNVYLMRYLGGVTPGGAFWLPVEKFFALQLDNSIVQRMQNPVTNPAWYHYDWIETFLDATQEFPNHTQIRSWERSTIWRMSDANQIVYFKAVPSIFAHEANLTILLNTKFPDNIPSVKQVSLPHSLCTSDYGTLSLMDNSDNTLWSRAMSLYAKMQINCIQHLDSLQEMNIPQRGLNWISHNLEVFFANDSNLSRGSLALTSEEITQLRRALPSFINSLKILEASNIPETLEHGDLWAGQIIVYNDNLLITDWSDSAITFPLFSLAFFLADTESTFQNSPYAHEMISKAYLGQWSHYLDDSISSEIITASKQLSFLYTALRYHYDILPNFGQQWEMENMIAYNLRLLLAEL